jgi:hypothetical protein
MRRVGAVLGAAALAVVLAPGTATADVLFDPADADELAATLDEAYQAQGVCYSWNVTIDNVGSVEDSVGSNFGAGRTVSDAPTDTSCEASVEFSANITWTSESSESEDSGSYSVFTTGGDRPNTADLDSLELISVDGLIGDNGDVEVYKAVSALPLLAADAGLADPIEATPAPPDQAGADAQPTNSPGSDFWRNNGMMILWGSVILLAGGVFAWWVIRTDRRRVPLSRRTTGPVRVPRAPVGPREEQIPAYVPEDWSKPAPEKPVEPTGPAEPEPTAVPEPQSEPAKPADSELSAEREKPAGSEKQAGLESLDELEKPAQSEKPAEPELSAEPTKPVPSESPVESDKSVEDPESPPEPTPEDDPDRTDDRTQDDPPEASSPDEPPRPQS